MAFITRLYPLEALDTGRPHATTECSWRLATRDGETVLQLDSRGSAARKDVGTVSQSLQLDESTARDLVAAIRTAFPSID
jgi:hypothetical protein